MNPTQDDEAKGAAQPLTGPLAGGEPAAPATLPVPAPQPAPTPRAAPAPASRAGHARAALVIAVGADLLQFVALPFFLPGAVSPWDDVLDVVVGLVLIRMLGWHWVFLPAFVSELVPGLELVPTWTAAVLFAIRTRRAHDAH